MQNPFEKILRAKDSQKRAKTTQTTAHKLYEHKPFFERWHSFKVVCSGLTYLCQAISPLLAFAVFFFLFADQLSFVGSGGSVILSGLFALALAAVIELTKRYSTKNALIEFFNYRSLGLALAISILCSAVSIGTSFYGAYILPSKLVTAPLATAPNLIDTEKLESRQIATQGQKQKAIKSKKQEIATYEKNNKSSSANRMSRRSTVQERYNTLKSQLHTLESDLSKLQASSPERLQKARSANKKSLESQATEQNNLTTAHEKQMTAKGLLLGYVCLSLELVFWLSMVFVFWYYRRVKTEFEQTPTLTANHHQPPPNDREQPAPTNNNQPHQIGFKTTFNQLANQCTTTTNNGAICLIFEGQHYPIERLRNNYHANNSKVKRYTRENKTKLAQKYKTASEHWANLIKILEQKKVTSG